MNHRPTLTPPGSTCVDCDQPSPVGYISDIDGCVVCQDCNGERQVERYGPFSDESDYSDPLELSRLNPHGVFGAACGCVDYPCCGH